MDNQLQKDFLEYICEVLNINSTNSMIILDIREGLKEVQDLIGFRLFIKGCITNLNDEYRYLTGYQKFIKLVDSFNKENKEKLENIVLDGMEQKVNDLIHKCRLIVRKLELDRPNNYPIEKLSYKNIPNYFENSEINLLETVGGFKRWFRDYDENDFKEDLLKQVRKLRLQFHTKQIGTKQDTKSITLQDIKDRR